MTSSNRQDLQKREVTSSFWLASGQLARVGAGFVVAVIVVRYLGAEEYGTLALALSLSGFFSAFAHMGIPRVLLKKWVSDASSDDRSDLLSAALLLQFVSSIIGLIGTYVVCLVLGKSHEVTLLAVIFSASFPVGGGVVLQQVFLANHSLKLSTFANMLGILVSLSYRIVLVLFTSPLLFFAAANFIQNCVFFIASLIFLKPIHQWRGPNFSRVAQNTRHLVRETLPIFAASLLQSISLHSDRVIIGAVLSIEEVGVYAIVLQLLGIPQLLISSYISGASPRLIPLLKTLDEEESIKSVTSALAIATSFGVVLLGAATLLIPFAMPHIYGNEFEVKHAVLAFIGLGMLLNFPNALRVEFLLCTGRQNLTVPIAALSTAFAIFVQITLSHMMGLSGIALAHMLNFVFSCAAINLMVPSLINYRMIYFASLGKGLSFYYASSFLKGEFNKIQRK